MSFAHQDDMAMECYDITLNAMEFCRRAAVYNSLNPGVTKIVYLFWVSRAEKQFRKSIFAVMEKTEIKSLLVSYTVPVQVGHIDRFITDDNLWKAYRDGCSLINDILLKDGAVLRINKAMVESGDDRFQRFNEAARRVNEGV